MLKISLLVYVAFGFVLYFGQRTMMYMPVPENPATDIAFEYVDVGGATLKVWVLGDAHSHAVLYFGGNAEDVYHNGADFRRYLPAHRVYLINYRGYGGSDGSPSESALFADALALFDRVATRHARISVVGRSLGSGVATYLASQRPVHRLVLITPHDSAVAVAKRLYPVYPVERMLKDRYESDVYAARVSAAVLLLTAEHDTIVPAEHSQRLADAFASDVVQQVQIGGVGHNGISGRDGYWRTMAEFLRD